MTENMRARVESAVEESNGALTIEFAKTAIAQKEKTISYWNSLDAWKQGYTATVSYTHLTLPTILLV